MSNLQKSQEIIIICAANAYIFKSSIRINHFDCQLKEAVPSLIKKISDMINHRIIEYGWENFNIKYQAFTVGENFELKEIDFSSLVKDFKIKYK